MTSSPKCTTPRIWPCQFNTSLLPWPYLPGFSTMSGCIGHRARETHQWIANTCLIVFSKGLKGRIVQPPKTGLKCSAAASTLKQTVACTILTFNNRNLVLSIQYSFHYPGYICLASAVCPDYCMYCLHCRHIETEDQAGTAHKTMINFS